MRVDLRVKHDTEARKAAIELFERGHGFGSAAKALSVPRGTVRQWLYVYRSSRTHSNTRAHQNAHTHSSGQLPSRPQFPKKNRAYQIAPRRAETRRGAIVR